MEAFLRMRSIDTLTTPNQKNIQNKMNAMDGIYVSYAIVIGIHRIILFDHLNNVQGFIFNGAVLSVEDAGPALSATILEPLRVSHPPLTAQCSVSPSPASSAFSGTTISDTNPPHDVRPVETHESSPDPPLSWLLSAPEYIPYTKHNNDTQSSTTDESTDNTTDNTTHCTEETDSNDTKEEERETGTNNSIVSVVGNRVVLIPPMKSIATTKRLFPLSNGISFSYNFRHKKCILRSGLKRSHTTFEPRRKPTRDANKRRSMSCGLLSVVRE
eukprot:272941_1